MAKNEIARPRVILDGKQAEEELDKLTQKAKKLRDAMHEAASAGDSQKEKRLQQELSRTTTEIRNLKKEAFDVDRVLKNINGASFNELSQAVRKATNDLKKMQQTDPGYGAQKDKVVALKSKMAELSREQSANVPIWSRMANGANKYFNMITLGIASITGVLFSFAQFVKGMVGLDDALADVMKTTGLTRKEVRGMYQDFRLLNTRTPRAELLLLAEEAGRLGKVGKKDIMAFVEVANKIKIALGDDLGGNTELAIREVGKLTEIFRVGNQYGTDFKTSMEKVGSGLNQVANNSNASAEYLIEYMKRLGGIATQARITAADIMGYASTFDQLGQNVEMAATAQSKVVVDMFTDPGKYAKIAKMEVGAFSKLLKTDANEAFIKFLDGLNGNSEGLSEMATKLDGLGIDGARAIQALAVLSANTKMLREQQDLANDAMDKGTSLQNEYAIKNNNLAGSWAKLTAFINAQFINSNFIGFLENVIGKLAKMVEVTHPLTKAMREEVSTVNILTQELANTNTPAQRRNEIYAELKRIAPDVVANINAENISITTLRGNLEKYNTEMIKKLALQDSEETLADKREAAGKATSERIENELKLQKEMNSLLQTYKSFDPKIAKEMEDTLFSNATTLDKYNKIVKIVGNVDFSAKTSVSVTQALKDEKEATDAVNKSLSAYMQRYEMVFGKEKKITVSPPPPPLGGSPSGTNPDGSNPDLEKDDKELSYLAQLEKKLQDIGKEREKLIVKGDEGTFNIADDKKMADLEAQARNINKLITDIKDSLSFNEMGASMNIVMNAQINAAKENAKITGQTELELQEDILKIKKDSYGMAVMMDGKMLMKKQMNNQIITEMDRSMVNENAKNQRQAISDLEELQEKKKAAQKELDNPSMTGDEAGIDAASMVTPEDIEFASKKHSIDQWTDYLIEKTNEQIKIKKQAFDNEKDIEKARQDLTDTQIGGMEQIAGAMAGMFEQGSAAQIAFFAIEKAAAIAQIWINYARESSAIAATAAAMNLVSFGVAGTAWAAIMQPKALLNAGINTAIIAAQAVAQVAGSKKAGGYAETDPSDDTPMGVYHANEFIGNAKSVRNPTVKKVYDIVRLAQEDGTISTLNLPAAMAATGMLPVGRQSGGYASPPAANIPQPYTLPSSGNGIPNEQLTRLNAILDRLDSKDFSIAIETYERKKDNWKKTTTGGLK